MKHIIWNEKIECANREDIKELQLTRLKQTVDLCYNKVALYKNKFDEIGLKPEHIKTLNDLKEIPFTTADDLKNNYPFGMFAAEKKDVVRLHGSSGTTGKPKIVGYTKNDLKIWSEAVTRVVCAAGATPEDVVQISFGYGLFTGGFGLHSGMENLGALVVPMSSGNTERQLMMMEDLETTILISTPSYALFLADEIEKRNVDKSKIKLRLALFGSEGHTPEMRVKIEKQLGILATENYGLSEVIGPGVSGECYKQVGMHIAEDHFLPEILDPNSLEQLPIGDEGEIVFTSLTKEAFPILRYRARDITRLIEEPCSCGRTSIRMEKVKGRTDDMLIIKATNVYPSQIESVLMTMDEVNPFYEIIVTKEGFMDKLEVKVEFTREDLLSDYRELDALKNKIQHALRSNLLVDAKVTLCPTGTLPRFEGKAKRVTDLR